MKKMSKDELKNEFEKIGEEIQILKKELADKLKKELDFDIAQKLVEFLFQLFKKGKEEHLIEVSVYTLGYLESCDRGVVTNINLGVRNLDVLFDQEDYVFELNSAFTLTEAKEIAQKLKVILEKLGFLVDEEVISIVMPPGE